MHRGFARTNQIRHAASAMNEVPALALYITDMGIDDGIDVTIIDTVSGYMLFETVLADPKSRTLLTFGSPESEVFWQCLHTREHVYRVQHLFLTARCRFSPLTAAMSTRRTGHTELRNVAFLRLIEEVLDELRTREPDMSVDVSVSYRNPKFADFINY